MDHEGLVTELNPAAEQTFAYSRAQALGKRLADLIIPSSLREAHRVFHLPLRSEEHAHVAP